MITAKTSSDVNNQIKALIHQMSLQEKVAQLCAYNIADLQTGDDLDFRKLEEKLRYGIGQITRLGGASGYLPHQATNIANTIQKFLREDTRLGIPAILHEECCAGLMSSQASIFPQPIGLASTFQPELAKAMCTTIRKQMLAIGARQGLAPVLDIARDPRWGRVEETFGEDPLLVSQFGIAYIQGLQGEDSHKGVAATGKHFVGHSCSQGGLNCAPVQMGWHDLWDVFLMPFQAAIREANLMSMMHAYPELDGEVIAASKRILTRLLRQELGFSEVVVSDYDAVVMLQNYHFIAETRRDAAIKAITAGIDVELPTITCYGEDLIEAVKKNELSEAIVNKAVERHLRLKFRLGLFDDPYVKEDMASIVFDTEDDRRLAYQIAQKSIVLLKNDGILPIKKGSRIALIGPNADSSRCMVGDYSYTAMSEFMSEMAQTTNGEKARIEGKPTNLDAQIPTLLEALLQKQPQSDILFAKGCDISSPDQGGFSEAVTAVENADVAILVLGGISGLARGCTTGEFRDATNLKLPGVQQELIEALLRTGKPIIVVLIDGRPVNLSDLIDHIPAVLEAWVPGEEGAKALVDVLYGDVNPAGRLPISFPRSSGQVPVFYNHKPSGMRSNIYTDYFDESVRPLFPFGHGLSYTTFKYAGLEIQSKQVKAHESVEITFTVENTGKVNGDEVIQLYIRDEFASSPRPIKELKGFARVNFEPGEKKTITFHLNTDQLAFYSNDLRLILEPGKFLVMIGGSSDNILLKDDFRVEGPEVTKIEERIFFCPCTIKNR